MTLVVTKKHMNLQKLIVVTCSAIVLALCGSGLSATTAEMRSSNGRQTFADWCREKDSLSSEAKHTVKVLLEKAETTECDAANQKLSSLTEISLRNNQISDIKPLASLTQIESLELNDNKISDIKPLQSLTNLTLFHIGGNPISPRICPIKPESTCDWAHWTSL